MHVVDFETREGAIAGLVVVTSKQVTDDRGTVREAFRRSTYQAAGFHLAPFQQLNVTESRRGAIRGMHAEAMTKLTTVAAGEAFGAYIDLRNDSDTYGVLETVRLRPGVQVLVPAGVANGFQALTDPCQYLYCFDAEWRPEMDGQACTPLDGELAIPWPITIDPDDSAMISAKDRNAPTFAELAGRTPS